MSDAVAATPAQEVPSPELVREMTQAERIANTVASLANSVTAVFGISGSGKSSLADTAAEYNWEVHKSTTFCYAIDPGGFGTKRLSLIRLGIMQAWRPGNHVNFFETMELISMGAIPTQVLDPETGYADPNVPLVLPRFFQYRMIGPCGHISRTFDNEVAMNSQAPFPAPCKECGTSVGMANCQKVETALVRNPKCKNIGLRIYDSISAESDQGLILELPSMSASGKLAKSDSGGSALGAADALTSGNMTFGTGSKSQVGFMQNRAYGWLMNIGKIPDQKTPPVCIFGVEQSKTDDETGGLVVLGPRIAGQARTGAVPGWVGNCVHAVVEQDAHQRMRHRLYLRTHVDAKDPRKIPYLAKHRGVPLGMPEFLEDPWDDDPAKRAAAAWSVCSLNYLFRLIDGQVATEVKRLIEKYPDAPALKPLEASEGDDVVEVVPTAAAPVVTSGTAVVSTPTIAGASVPMPQPAIAGIAPPRGRSRAVPQTQPAPAVAVAPLPPAPPVTVTPAVQPPTVTPPVQPPPATAAVPETQPVPAGAQAPATVPAAPVVVDQPAAAIPASPAPAAAGVAASTPGAVPPPAVPSPDPEGPQVVSGPIAPPRRRPRPPVS